MIRLLPFILIPILIIGVLGYWRYKVSQESLTTPQTEQNQVQAPIEVPKTLPNATIEDRVKSIEDLLLKLVPEVNNLKSQPQNPGSLDSRVSAIEADVTGLKARVSALEKSSPAPAAASGTQSVVYIPLGSGGGPWGSIDWNSLAEYEISLDPANYPGYTGMKLEATFRLGEAVGTGSVRLFNMADSSAVSGQLDTTSTSFTLFSTSSFKLPTGTKTYRLQVKSSQGRDLFLQSARIKVSF